MDDKVCIIIPVKGQAPELRQCLDSLLSVDYPSVQVIVVDDGLDSQPHDILHTYANKVTILDSHGGGPSRARNLAAGATEAAFFAFTDGDCEVDKNWLQELTWPLKKNSKAIACGGSQRLPLSATSFEQLVYLFMKKVGFITDYMRPAAEGEVVKVAHNPSCNSIYRREVFLKEQGFLEGLWPSEDVELDYRLTRKGYTILFNPRAIVYHHKPKNIKSFIAALFRYGLTSALLTKQYGFFRPIQYVPLVFMAGVIAFIAAVLVKSASVLLIVLCVAAVLVILYFEFRISVVAVALLGVSAWVAGFFKGLCESSHMAKFYKT